MRGNLPQLHCLIDRNFPIHDVRDELLIEVIVKFRVMFFDALLRFG